MNISKPSSSTAATANNNNEVPLQLEDFSCVNFFEFTSSEIEKYITDLCLHSLELKPHLVFNPTTTTATTNTMNNNNSSSSSMANPQPAPKEEGAEYYFTCSPMEADEDLVMSSEEGDEDNLHTNNNNNNNNNNVLSPLRQQQQQQEVLVGERKRRGSYVVGKNYELKRKRKGGRATTTTSSSNNNNNNNNGSNQDNDDDDDDNAVKHIAVELHIDDYEHPIYRQFHVPLFFLIKNASTGFSHIRRGVNNNNNNNNNNSRSAGNGTFYKNSESTYYLSLLATAVANVFSKNKNKFYLRPLEMNPPVAADEVESRITAAAAAAMARTRTARVRDLLSSTLTTTSTVDTNTTNNTITAAAAAAGEEEEDDDAILSSWPLHRMVELPTPYKAHCNFIPCFAPTGDVYAQTYTGMAPALPAPPPALLFHPSSSSSSSSPVPPSQQHHSPTQNNVVTNNVLLQAHLAGTVLGTKFCSTVLDKERGGSPSGGNGSNGTPKTISDYCDLLKLKIGSHSRILDNDTSSGGGGGGGQHPAKAPAPLEQCEGICVSVNKCYKLPIPMNFTPLKTRRLPHNNSSSIDTIQKSGAAALPLSFKWEELMSRHNKLACEVLYGSPHQHPPPSNMNTNTSSSGGSEGVFDGSTPLTSFSAPTLYGTHAFGVLVPPIEQLRFFFFYKQLHDYEAVETKAKQSYLDPFSASASAVAAEVAQRCSIVVEVDVKPEHTVRHQLSVKVLQPAIKKLVARLEDPMLSEHDEALEGGGAGLGPEARREEEEMKEDGVLPPTRNYALESLIRNCVEKLMAKDTTSSSSGRLFRLQREGQQRILAGLRSPTAFTDGQAAADSRAGAAAPATTVAAMLQQLRQLKAEREEAHQRRKSAAAAGGESAANHKDMVDDMDGCGDYERREPRRASPRVALKDLREAYFPGSLLSRLALLFLSENLNAAYLLPIWRRTVQRLQSLYEQYSAAAAAGASGGHHTLVELLELLGLPPPRPPVVVDLTQSLLCQKLQLLAFGVGALLPRYPRYAPDPGAAAAAGEEQRGAADEDEVAGWTLLSGGERARCPAPLPPLPASYDVLLQQSQVMNEMGTGRRRIRREDGTTNKSSATDVSITWLQQNASIYNDMCLFLYANKAHEGRVVRFPDFIRWSSPRDYRQAPPPAAAAAAENDDDRYLSTRMQRGRPQEEGARPHVWWQLWEAAQPRSRRAILAGLFDAAQTVRDVLTWLDQTVSERALLADVAAAILANGAHRLLAHPHLSTEAARRPALWRYAQRRVTSLTESVAAATAGLDTTLLPFPRPLSEMEVELVATQLAGARREVEELETALLVSVALEELLTTAGATAEEAAAQRELAAQLSAPAATQDATRGCLQLRPQRLRYDTWLRVAAPCFMTAESRRPSTCRVRLSCLAERPWDTAACFQQLIVEEDESSVSRFSFTLSKEVL